MFRQLRTADVFLILSAIPVPFLFLLAPENALSWAGMGRGGLLFVYFLLGYELMDYRKAPSAHLNRNRKIAIATIVAAGLSYFGAIALFKPLTDFIYQIVPRAGPGSYSISWLMATEYMALTSYVVGLAAAFFGWRAILKIITGIIFSAGTLITYLLDAFSPFFPYGSLYDPYEAWTEFKVAAVAFLASISNLPIYGWHNVLTIYHPGMRAWRLVIFTPSAFVYSIVIYSLVVVILAARLHAPSKRKIAYAVAGVGGILFLDIIRVFAIAYYWLCCALSLLPLGWNAFQNTIGQFLYPVWIIAYLYIVREIEKRLHGNPTNPLLTGQSLTESG